MSNTNQLERLHSHLTAVWRRDVLTDFRIGLAVFLLWSIPVFLVAVLIDWLVDLPGVIRGGGCLIMLALSSIKAWRAGWKQLRRYNPVHVALRVEDRMGGLESLLVSAVQFDASAAQSVSSPLVELTCRKAADTVETFESSKLLTLNDLLVFKKRGRLLALFVVIFALAFSLLNPFLNTGFTRFFAPWLAVSYPTRTNIELQSKDMIVKEGSPVTIQARIKDVIPETATLHLRTGKGRPRKHTLPVTDKSCKYTVETAFRSFEYRISAGDARSAWQSVQVIPSPRIKKADVILNFPEYTKRPTETVEAMTITIPESTRITWKLTLDRAISKATAHFGEKDEQPLDISEDGLRVTLTRDANESRAYSFTWVEREHSFVFASPSHYLQVAPDQRPSVELTQPKSNLYATLGRKLDLAYRARDDHGIGELHVIYKVNKTEPVKVKFDAPALDAGEQKLDWDYRTALPRLEVGDSVLFSVEVKDRYPGAGKPHRVRSQSRRISFLSREDYLKKIAQQQKRIYSKILRLYREERVVHNVVRNLNPADDVFAQTCQLEAVRQDMLRERLNGLRQVMQELITDMAANNITDAAEIKTFTALSKDLQVIADEHVGAAANSLRSVAAAANSAKKGTFADSSEAVHMVDSAARELACLLMDVGFREATEAMARELHATAQAQASIRARTIVAAKTRAGKLAELQADLSKWLTRLLAKAPGHKESSVEEALVAFNLSLLTKKLQRTDRAGHKMSEASKSISTSQFDEAARIQADVIKSLLYAEFRLRTGSEREALDDAGDLFRLQARDLKKLRLDTAALTDASFSESKPDLERRQAEILHKLRLLLMPSVPAKRIRLFDTAPHAPPPVYDLLAKAEKSIEDAAAHLAAGDRKAAEAQQLEAESSFQKLSEITRKRMEILTELVRMEALTMVIGDSSMKIELFDERQGALLEKTEDAAAKKSASDHLAALQLALAGEIELFAGRIAARQKLIGSGSEALLKIAGGLDRAVTAMRASSPFLSEKKPDAAIVQQELAHSALKETRKLFTEYQTVASMHSGSLSSLHGVAKPSACIAELLGEQRDLIASMRKLKKEQLPTLAVPQKNLVHAVNAVLSSLDVFSHLIDTGTVMLFAKDDMGAAGEALATSDLEEALDASTAVEEALVKLAAKIDAMAPQFVYVHEMVDAMADVAPDILLLHAEQAQLQAKALAAPDAAALKILTKEQAKLTEKVQTAAARLKKITGRDHFGDALKYMAAAEKALAAGNADAAEEQMTLALGEDEEQKFEKEDKEAAAAAAVAAKATTLGSEKLKILFAMEVVPFILAPPMIPGKPPAPEVALARSILAVGSDQKGLYWKTLDGKPEKTATLAPVQNAITKRANGLTQPLKSHPKIVLANSHMAAAAANLSAASKIKAMTSQREAGEAVRHVLIEYAVKNLVVPPPAAAQESDVPAEEESDTEQYKVFMPGAVTGTKPKDGRQKWEILATRDRAALNENFARELPLEYRSILKDYYERMANWNEGRELEK